jgi:hypothetical protein
LFASVQVALWPGAPGGAAPFDVAGVETTNTAHARTAVLDPASRRENTEHLRQTELSVCTP